MKLSLNFAMTGSVSYGIDKVIQVLGRRSITQGTIFTPALGMGIRYGCRIKPHQSET